MDEVRPVNLVRRARAHFKINNDHGWLNIQGDACSRIIALSNYKIITLSLQNRSAHVSDDIINAHFHFVSTTLVPKAVLEKPQGRGR